jgi:protein-L-isoaspartate O-methyltransferase
MIEIFIKYKIICIKFVQGNCMNLAVTSDMLLYDRIYVGAGVTDQEEQFLTSLLKIDGILIMPLNDSVFKTFKAN